MSSERKYLSNRLNALRSTGPKTSIGKATASRNAIRHGLSAVAHRGDSNSETERIANLICPSNADPFEREQAMIIAESTLNIMRIRELKTAAVERIREQRKKPVRPSMNRSCFDYPPFKSKTNDILRLEEEYHEYYRGRTEAAAAHAAGLLEPRPDPQDELREMDQCVRLALPDLLALDRYENRAMSRRRRAIKTLRALAEAR